MYHKNMLAFRGAHLKSGKNTRCIEGFSKLAPLRLAVTLSHRFCLWLDKGGIKSSEEAGVAMDSAVKYLVAGSVFSVVTSVLWCLWARFERSLQSFIFQCVASRFKLSFHNLQGACNIVTITRILDQLQLKTHTYLWQPR